ncbi:MAG: 50S ribosomal protein L5 [Mycoplasmataceae bacterium RC_NB112A]|nr:MAG: 50S ribosomal protein L5 [Mycoplasmataceae bacterium RC_NB112A]KLL02260.1 MAG: 50S ribosomal protein L5 [Mycoplasmataceae bacterium RC_NB112A]
MLIVNNWWEKKRAEIKKKVRQRFQHTSPMATTDLRKIVLNSGVGKAAIKNIENLKKTQQALQEIAFGQKSKLTYAYKSIVGFKLRQGTPIGCKVVLRGKKIWDFLFNLINLNLPSIASFSGISVQKFDQHRRYYFKKEPNSTLKKVEKVQSWNYNFGIEDLNIFPSVPYDLTFENQGIQVTLVFKSGNKEENIYFLRCLGFPFAEKEILPH